MELAKNLQYLRKRDKITQEELADKLDVSRQAVSKWETGEAYPETEKLLVLCDMFDVTLDELMRGDPSNNSSGAETAEISEPKENIKTADHATFSAHINIFSRAIAIGVLLIILGAAACVAICGYSFMLTEKAAEVTSIMSGVVVIIFAAVSVFLFVFYGMRHEKFRKEYPLAESEPDKEKSERFSKRFAVTIACLVSGLLLDIVFLILLTTFISNDIIVVADKDAAVCYTVSAFLAVVAFIVGRLTFMGMQRLKYHTEEYNKKNGVRSKKDKIKDALCSVIMMSATVVFFLVGFIGGYWQYNWLAFPIGGILCGIVSVIIYAVGAEK